MNFNESFTFQGFMGKVLLDKLLRTCPGIENIYLLIRKKKGKDIHTRIEELFDDPVSYTSDFLEGFDRSSPNSKVTGVHYASTIHSFSRHFARQSRNSATRSSPSRVTARSLVWVYR